MSRPVPRDVRSCAHCGSEFSIDRWSKKRFCSFPCSHKSLEGIPRLSRRVDDKFRKNRRISKIKTPDGRKILRHRYLMELKVGRPLEVSETVHHIDCDPLNNAIENLWLFDNESLHQLAHHSLENLLPGLIRSGAVIFREGRYVAGPLVEAALAVAVTASET